MFRLLTCIAWGLGNSMASGSVQMPKRGAAPEVGRQRDREVAVAAVQLQQVVLVAASGHPLCPRQHLLTHASVGLAEGSLHLALHGDLFRHLLSGLRGPDSKALQSPLGRGVGATRAHFPSCAGYGRGCLKASSLRIRLLVKVCDTECCQTHLPAPAYR